MYISHKSNVIQHIHEQEWQCRRKSKDLDKSEYWTWIDTITTQDDDGHDVITYPSEDFTIVECTDEDVWARLTQLDDYISTEPKNISYNIKYYASKRDSEIEGVQSHFIGDDDAKDARLLAEEWTNIRRERTRLLAETDWMAMSDNTVSAAWKTYRQELRDLPDDQSSKTSYDDIVWPSKPS